MKNNNKIFNLFLSSIPIYCLFLIVTGCGGGGSDVGLPPWPSADCIPTNTDTSHYFTYQNAYMKPDANGVDFQLHPDDPMWKGFHYRCGINVVSIVLIPIDYSIIITYGGNDSDIVTNLNTFYLNHKISNYDTSGFACGIDSISNCPDQSIVGWTIPGYKWSFIFNGRLHKIPNIDYNAYSQADLVHELGHQIGIVGHEEGCYGLYGYDTTEDGDTCIMYESINDLRAAKCVFCNNHACTLWDATQNNNFYASNQKKIFSQDISQDLVCEIYTDKKEFLEGEKFCIIIKIKNASQKVLTVRNPFYERCMPLTISKNNTIIKYIGSEITYTKIPKIVLQPGEEIQRNFDLLDNFGTIRFNDMALGLPFYLPEGEYRLYWTNPASNEWIINIKKPINDENQAWKEFQEINIKNPPLIYDCYDKMFDEKRNSFRAFAKTHPESVYMNQAFCLSLCCLNPDTNLLEACRWFINQRYNSIDTISLNNVIDWCIKAIKNSATKESVTSFLSDIIEQYPNSTVYYLAEKYLIAK